MVDPGSGGHALQSRVSTGGTRHLEAVALLERADEDPAVGKDDRGGVDPLGVQLLRGPPGVGHGIVHIVLALQARVRPAADLDGAAVSVAPGAARQANGEQRGRRSLGRIHLHAARERIEEFLGPRPEVSRARPRLLGAVEREEDGLAPTADHQDQEVLARGMRKLEHVRIVGILEAGRRLFQSRDGAPRVPRRIVDLHAVVRLEFRQDPFEAAREEHARVGEPGHRGRLS